MKRARFQAEMDLDDDSESVQRRPPAPRYQSRPPPPPSQDRIPGFFGLPEELKAHIFDLVLNSDRVDPPKAPYLGDHDKGPGEIRYPTHYKSWRWPSTHWTSKAFRNDIIDHAENQLSKRQVRPELDIMVNGFVFFPTWLYLPPDLPGDIPFDLDVSLRIFSGEAFRSNDGWPRQPGSGFRLLLKLLNQLVYEGPSFGHHFEILAGKATWKINTLRVNVSFHDNYTPATWPETSREIFRMLKGLATSGLAQGIVKTISAHCEYRTADADADKTVWDSIWPVAARVNDAQAAQWRQTGFLQAHQRTLADDYRPPLDLSSGPPLRRPPSLTPRVDERRDSPVGIIAPVTKNPQMDDYGLITPPTPRPRASASVERDVGLSKRRSTPVPPGSSSTNGLGAGDLSGQFDDYSTVMTPNMSTLYDDYSVVMTPVPGGPIEDESDY